MQKQTKKTMLLGEGIHQHVLYGSFETNEEVLDYQPVNVEKKSLLKHEHPSGVFGEHNTLEVSPGRWVMGKQVEFNPFTKEIERVWD